jgi:hypothetical protein
MLGILLCNEFNKLNLFFSEETTNAYAEFFLSAPADAPFDLFVHLMLSVYWHYAFLDTYRCFEMLFVAHKAADFCNACSINGDWRQVANHLFEVLGWRPHEETGLIGLFKQLPIDVIETGERAVNSGTMFIAAEVEYGKRAEKLAKKIYRMRNSIVHFRLAGDSVSKITAEWNEIILFCVRAADFLLSKFFKLESDGGECGGQALHASVG